MTRTDIQRWIVRVFKRILVEFSIPASAATIINLLSAKPSLSNWSLSFISISWITAQIFRIIKQQRVEGEFDLVKSKLGDMVERIEVQTKKVIGYSTGGDSNSFIYPIANHQDQIQLFIVNESEFSCYIVSIGMYEFTYDEKSVELYDRNHPVIHPVLWYGCEYIIPPFSGRKRYKIHHQTRVGCSYVQYILAERIDNKYVIAFTKWVNGKVEYVIPNDFPGYDQGNPEKLFEEMKKNQLTVSYHHRLLPTKVFAKAGLDIVTSAMCILQQRLGHDVQYSALVLNFNNIFSNGHLYRAGQSMNSLPSQILESCLIC